jgi:hypothetical protein
VSDRAGSACTSEAKDPAARTAGVAILPQPSRDHAARHRPEHLSPFSPDRVEHDFIEEEEIIDLDDPARIIS